MIKNLIAAVAGLGLSATGVQAHDHSASDSHLLSPQNMQLSLNDSGVSATVTSAGAFDTRNAFFDSTLGSNGRNCATCHQSDQGMGISAAQSRELFRRTRGKDPLFAAIDGANCPSAKTGDAAAHSLILSHGLIRTFMQIPLNAQFTVRTVYDPYGCSLSIDSGGVQTVSQYRRPLPTANVRFLSTMMWDGRESPAAGTLGSPDTFEKNLNADLAHQAQSAITGHFQGPVASPAKIAEIVAFEMGISNAQIYDWNAGYLAAYGATGGPKSLMSELYYPGINDVLGADPNGVAFDNHSMTLYTTWANGGRTTPDDDRYDRQFGPGRTGAFDRARVRRDIAAGEELFNSAPLTIRSVRGLNDNAQIGAALAGTCTTCHDTPNLGHHSLPLPLDIGTGHSPRAGFETDPAIIKAMAELDAPDLPVFEVMGCPDPFNAGVAASFYTTDLGKGAITGQCADMNRLKGPILRGLASRAPYFHNGAASSLEQLVNFYNQRFAMNLTAVQKRQLVAFLNAL